MRACLTCMPSSLALALPAARALRALSTSTLLTPRSAISCSSRVARWGRGIAREEQLTWTDLFIFLVIP